MSNTLHIFISGYRSAYRVAALNAVCAPISSSQKFTFSEGKSVSAKTQTLLSAAKPGDPALITFVDRFGEGGYRYIPVRRARFATALVDAGKVEITIVFDEWPSSVPGRDYSKWVLESLVPIGAAHLVGDAENDHDGEYLFFGPEPAQEYFGAEDGWRNLVESLSKTRALEASAS